MCCLVRSLLVYIGTPMVAAKVWKVEDIAHEVVDDLAGLLAEFYPLFDPFTRRGVVLLMVVEIRVHEQFHNLEDLNIEVLGMLNQLEELYPDVDIWQFFHVALVEVTHFDPPIHQIQWHFFILFLIFGDLIVVVDPSSLLHELSVSVLEATAEVDEHKHYETPVEGEDQHEANPSNVVV